MPTGTYDISTLQAARFQSVADFGENNIFEILQRDLETHNMIMQELVSGLTESSTDRQRIYGTSARGEMKEVDEFGAAPAQTDVTGATVAFPLRKYQFNVGWTRQFFLKATPAEIAEQFLKAQKEHRRKVSGDIKRAVYVSGNYSFRDHLEDNVTLAIKRFVNADSDPIPDGPNGETFDGATHTHYLAIAGGAITTAAADNLIETVVEHGHGGAVRVAIHRSDENSWRGLNGFNPYPDPRIQTFRNTTDPDVPMGRLDISRVDNRAIGIYNAAEIWVKPWAISLYPFCWDMNGPKPLVFRQDRVDALQGLRIVSEDDAHPLRCEFLEVDFGVGVNERTNGAVHYVNNAVYQDPVITP